MTEEIKKISVLPEVTSLVDADIVPVSTDIAGTPLTAFIKWLNIKAVLKTYFDALYPPQNGWIPSTATWTYSSADSPTFVISINADMTTVIGVGNRIKLTQTTAKYFIVTAVGSYSGGNTLITVYGGTDYTLANAAITSPYYSSAKSPFGFPITPSKWTVLATDGVDRSQTTPTPSTWYNLGSFSISIPVGLWKVSYVASEYGDRATVGDVGIFISLSTANNSASNSAFTRNGFGGSVTALTQIMSVVDENLNLASKTTYYLIQKTQTGSISSIQIFGAASALTTIRAVCAYL